MYFSATQTVLRDTLGMFRDSGVTGGGGATGSWGPSEKQWVTKKFKGRPILFTGHKFLILPLATKTLVTLLLWDAWLHINFTLGKWFSVSRFKKFENHWCWCSCIDVLKENSNNAVKLVYFKRISLPLSYNIFSFITLLFVVEIVFGKILGDLLKIFKMWKLSKSVDSTWLLIKFHKNKIK